MANYATILQWDSAIKKVYKERFLVQVGKKLLPITVDEIAYFYADAKLVMVALNNERHYIINHTLSELERLLNPADFYRVNRKFIINIQSIKSLQMEKNYKWQLQLMPAPNFKVSIPTEKLANFKSWVSR
jgi:two-component system LytT family response regulator